MGKRDSVLTLVGVQRHAHHAAEDAAHGKDPPGGAPHITGQPQPHIDGGGQGHQSAAEGAHEVLSGPGLGGGVVVPVVLPDLVLVVGHPAVDQGHDRTGHDGHKQAHGNGLVWLLLGEELEEQEQQHYAEEDAAYDERAKLKKEARLIDTMKANVDIFLKPSVVQEPEQIRDNQRE